MEVSSFLFDLICSKVSPIGRHGQPHFGLHGRRRTLLANWRVTLASEAENDYQIGWRISTLKIFISYTKITANCLFCCAYQKLRSLESVDLTGHGSIGFSFHVGILGLLFSSLGRWLRSRAALVQRGSWSQIIIGEGSRFKA